MPSRARGTWEFAGSANGTSKASVPCGLRPGQRCLSGSHPRSSLEVGDDSMVDEAVTDDAEIVTDVCVVGAGPAGITIARELDKSGVGVCLLEAGGRDIGRSFQRQSRGQSDGYPIYRLDGSRIRAFGGTLRHPRIWEAGWAARPLDPIDFEMRDGRPEFGWPFDRKHLDPYYTRAQRVCGVRPFDVVAHARAKRAPADALALDNGELESTVFQYPTTAFHDAWDALSASSNVRVLLETRAAEIRVDSSGRRVNRIVAVQGRRERVVIRPRLVVFAAGGIENARLLLTSNEGRGLGNEHDLVGRYFAERMSFHAGHVVLSDKTSVDRLDFFHRPNGAEDAGALRVRDKVQQEQDLLNVVFFLVPRPAAVISNAVRSLTTMRKAVDRRPLVDGIGWHMKNALAGVRDLADLARSRVVSTPRILALRAQGEQAPNRDSRVTLGSKRDDLGIPVARITWRMTVDDHRSVAASARVVDATLRAQGLGYVEWTARLDSTTLVEGNHHHLGTTRMHADPHRGVVGPDCRVHSVDNLYIAGCSVFPTYGASNPTLTIVALALRLADTLREVLVRTPVRRNAASRS
jgi:choline dehydrogenase-like flavoprotein